jgi:hypothetical protein
MHQSCAPCEGNCGEPEACGKPVPDGHCVDHLCVIPLAPPIPLVTTLHVLVSSEAVPSSIINALGRAATNPYWRVYSSTYLVADMDGSSMRGRVADCHQSKIVMASAILSEQRPSNPNASRGVWMSLNYVDIIVNMHTLDY